jgi:coenzyme F420 hydrogenase subunit beta
MKTFTNLIQEVQERGLCHHCGGCVSFCTAINYGALEMGEDGRPRYANKEKCIECGICYSLCPEIGELDEELKNLVSWSAPMGRILGTVVGRALDPEVQARATDGGVVTALLLRLFDRGHIDAAIVSKKVAPFKRQPSLALSREDILNAAGFHFDTLAGMHLFSDVYSTYSPSITRLKEVVKMPHSRVAFVGTPCQINTLRRMEVLGVVPSDAIKFHFGLFCSGNFQFGPEQRRELEKIGNFNWVDVYKVNVKEDLMIHLHNKKIRHIPLDQLTFMKRYACQFCDDYAAEYADLSFGGIGAPEGWTTVIVRSPLGRAVLADATGTNIERFNYKENPSLTSQAMAKVMEWSEKKKQSAAEKHQKLEKNVLEGKG